jgi:hypothetical protein
MSEKKFCKVCGARLQDLIKTVSYNEYDGSPIFNIIRAVCPDQGKHARAKVLFGEDLED